MLDSRKQMLLVAAIALAVAGVLLFVYFLRSGASGSLPPSGPFQNTAYVWQSQWSAPVAQAIAEAGPGFEAFAVLAAEADGRRMTCRTVALDWPAVAAARKPVTGVLRINSGLAAHLRDAPKATSKKVAQWARDILNDARSRGLVLTGLQLDYDCPTSSLRNYRLMLDELRTLVPDTHWSITALPSWLGSREFATLVAPLDEYVLQVHSLEKPAHIDDQVTLCDPAAAMRAVERASRIGVPFFVALPTYGYRLLYDETGAFVALTAEGAPEPSSAVAVRELHADPVAMAALVRRLIDSRPPWCLGIAWFRLPVATDSMNWTLAALNSVKAGRAPEVRYTAEVRTPQADLHEVWVTNTGDTTLPHAVHFDVAIEGGRVRASDYLGSFAGTPTQAGSYHITGPLPKPGASAMAAWFRAESVGAAPTTLTVTKQETKP